MVTFIMFRNKLFFTILLFSSFFSNGMEEEDVASRFCHALAEGIARDSGLTGDEYTREYAEAYHDCENTDWEPPQ
ncbi:hypothetical protein SAMN02745246_02251 [Leeuwenhoekiella marinoflava DSM 3653]|uniref:Uncharacterized protein n=2 Tax=Leeuwenhoekiella marinoflava TaxID=988 RepID=A0A4Q0PLG2_9FLAO|nr:hypothetical protein DSL99_2114 [Leeuwenhoekiella marinoflava]SHF34110.1 hypothetical protein SAMN02745246_02251 [Leeuwenhoekiella marinoflava DSM 3653]